MIKIIAENKKVYRDYEILEEIEAGIELLGGEVKSIKNGAISLKDSFVKFEGGEAFILNLYIAPYKYSGSIPYDPERKRKLLLKKTEIKRLIGKVKERGLTIVPLKVYLKRKWIKVLIGLVRGRKKYEKRQIIKEREIKREERNELRFCYRKGIKDGIIIEAEFELEMKDKKEIKEAKRRVIFMRKEKQPIDKKTAGCIFKNPPGNFAGKLIEEAGCKGKRIGDAMVSLKHANFIENMGNAKFEDVKNLIEYIKERVYKKFGINLEEEVIIIEK